MAGQRLYHSVAEQIIVLIEKGVFPPGARLPGERELAERFDVSRVTIREAEIALQATGRIDIKTGSGVYVCEEQPTGFGTLPDVSAFEVTEARSLIEAESAALAAKVITNEKLTELDELIVKMSSKDPEVSLVADRDFHAAIAESSGNGAVLHTVRSLWKMREDLPQVKHSYEAVCDADSELRAKEHLEILNALKARNPDAARTAMREHFLRLIESMLNASEEKELKEVQQRASESRERFLKLHD